VKIIYSYRKLERFLREIANLTLNHDVINDRACVTARKLGNALEKVDANWWKIQQKETYGQSANNKKAGN